MGRQNKKAATDTPTRADLKVYLRNRTVPCCLQAASPPIRAVWDQPECSIPGHRLEN